ncbi:MAG: PAS domain S-box protein [Planctomycetota bacterium]|jgi:PAS domain S-box-containing protein
MPERQHQHPGSNDILIVDDETPKLQLLSGILAKEGYPVRQANDPQRAIESALAHPPKLILLDVKMPEMDGFEVCRRLKQDKRTREIPIVFISSLQDVQDRVLCFDAGGVDYISKPFNEPEVLARVRTHMELRNMQLNQEKVFSEHANALSESEALFRATFELAAVGIAHVSPEGRFLRTNRKFCDIVGYTADEMMNLKFQDITHPDDLATDMRYVNQLLAGELETYTLEKRYIRKGGEWVWIHLTVSLASSEAGPKWFVAVIKDISERKQAEEVLRQNHDFLDHLTSAVPDAIFSVKMPERTINWVNDSFNVLGYKPEETIGQSTKKYYANPEDYDKVGKIQQDAIRRGEDVISTEVMVRRKDGTVIPAELTATFYKEEGKLINTTAMVRDITERKQAEKQMDILKSELLHATRVDTMVELTAALAHEINHPLGSILNNANAAKRFLEHKEPDLDEIREIIGDIISEDKRAGDVIAKLRSLMKKADIEYAQLEINTVIEGVLKLTNSEIVFNHISLSKQFEENLPKLKGDSIQLQQVFLNLIMNAMDAMRDSQVKHLTISTSQHDAQFILVCVTDSGAGFDENEKDNLFKPFFTTKKEGMGMGLSVIKTIINAHGGDIWPENNQDGGASFFVKLPIDMKEL